MTTHLPIGDLQLTGHTPESEARDERALLAIEEHLPDLTDRVRAYLRGQASRAVADAFGNLDAFVGALTEVAAEHGDPIDAPTLRRSLAQEVDALRADVTPSAVAVTDETRHARRELTGYWVDLLLAAWTLWSAPLDGLPLLGEDLLPARDTCPEASRADWDEFLPTAHATLLAEVALTKDDVAWAGRAACTSVRRALEHGQVVALPNSLVLRRIGNEFRLLRA